MLIISRKIGEIVNVGDDIKVVVLGREGNQIKLGFEAPKHMKILRDEATEHGYKAPPKHPRKGLSHNT